MQRSANGVVVLVLGILSLAGFGCLTGLPAWIIGNQSLQAIDRGQADPSERGIVQVGRILGMISTLVLVAGVALWLTLVIFIAGVGALFALHR